MCLFLMVVPPILRPKECLHCSGNVVRVEMQNGVTDAKMDENTAHEWWCRMGEKW